MQDLVEKSRYTQKIFSKSIFLSVFLAVSLFFSVCPLIFPPLTDAKNITDMIRAVERAFTQYDPGQLERVHACLFTVYRQILENNGSNQYDMRHEGSRKRQRDGSDVRDLTVTRELVRAGRWVVYVNDCKV